VQSGAADSAAEAFSAIPAMLSKLGARLRCTLRSACATVPHSTTDCFALPHNGLCLQAPLLARRRVCPRCQLQSPPMFRPWTRCAPVLLTGALHAGDVYTRIVPPALSSAFQTDTTGQLVHTGIQVSRAARTGRNVPPPLLVAGVMEGSAAERAGISVGSQLLAINGRSTAALPDECARSRRHASCAAPG